ncbi:leucine-rich repeat domain-containing protein [Capilliphycus salinus ALCB114379]|uniref:leucine-rich repeat domain-containing protein n=1 Tax=Capilliphycus salinus TaxID=2768948 RepID=UPI0039A73767
MKRQLPFLINLLLAIAVLAYPHTGIAQSESPETDSPPEAELTEDSSSPSQAEGEYKSFMDWCMNREKLSPAARRTMSMILQRAGTFNCARASENLTNISQLDLSTSQISDISPLGSLTTITQLKLINNQITDLTPLQSLTNLTELNLSYNKVTDVTPLQSLENLNLLNLSYNQVKDVSPLQSLKKLNELNLNNNQVVDISSLQPLDRLTYLFVRDNPIQDETCPVTPKYICQF